MGSRGRSEIQRDMSIMPENETPPAIRIHRVGNREGWQRLETRWDELLSDSTADAVFLCWAWLDTWLEVYGDGGEWVVLVAEDPAGRLLGIAPMMLDRAGSKGPGKWVRRLMLLGQKADTASEYLDWIVRRGFEDDVTGAVARHVLQDMAGEWDLIEFSTVREDSMVLAAMRRAFKAAGADVAVKTLTTSPYLPLPASWDEFLAGRRGKFKQRWSKLHRDHRVELRFGGVDFSVDEGMAKLQQLNQQRWGESGTSFRSARYVRFHQQVANRLHKEGRLLLIFLELDGQIIAGRYDFVHGGKAWCFQGGWLPEWEKRSAGKMLVTEIIRWAIQQGLREYDFLGGSAAYKSDWTDTCRTLVTVTTVNPRSWRGRSFLCLRDFKRRLTSLMAR